MFSDIYEVSPHRAVNTHRVEGGRKLLFVEVAGRLQPHRAARGLGIALRFLEKVSSASHDEHEADDEQVGEEQGHPDRQVVRALEYFRLNRQS